MGAAIVGPAIVRSVRQLLHYWKQKPPAPLLYQTGCAWQPTQPLMLAANGGSKMSRAMQRIVLETGLKLDVNQLLRDGILRPGKVTEPSDHCWFNDDGQQIAHARIGSNMTMTGTGTMRVAAYLDRQTQSYRTCSDGQRRSCHWRALNSSDPLFGRLQNVSAALRYG